MASGISAILQAVSLLGILVIIAGVGLLVVASSQGRSIRGGMLLAIFGLVIFGVFQIISRGVFVVDPTQVGVVFRTVSGELTEPRQPGTHVIIPVFEQSIIYPTVVQEYTMSGQTEEGDVQGNDAVNARTQDGQTVTLDITVFYRIDDQGGNVNDIHRSWYDTRMGNRFNMLTFENAFVRPTVRALVRDTASQYTAREIYGESRTAMRQAMQETVAERFAEEGLLLTDLLLRDVTFSNEFTAAIEQAQVAEQDALRAEIRVREVQQEAQQAIARARGERDAAIERARGRAAAAVIQAQAEAEALRVVSEQIAANPGLIQYLYVQNLSDNISLALVPSSSPFLFDFASLPEAMENFQAPASQLDAESLTNPEESFSAEELGIDEVIPEITPVPTTEGSN